MIVRIYNFLTIAAVLFFLTLVMLTVPSFYVPEFEVVNSSAESISVIALWRSNEKIIDNIEPMSSHEFSVNDEAAMKFRVRYSNGKVIESEPLYFTSGTKVIATISSDGVEVRYDFQT